MAEVTNTNQSEKLEKIAKQLSGRQLSQYSRSIRNLSEQERKEWRGTNIPEWFDLETSDRQTIPRDIPITDSLVEDMSKWIDRFEKKISKSVSKKLSKEKEPKLSLIHI